ncbi:MAG: stage III sporulation protein AG [Acetatifactor sp.]|nr:stage III sporulation protein AG [Acetatifactor sp.]
MEKIRKWLEQKGYEKWFKRDNLIILVLAGVLLFIIALPSEDGSDREDTAPMETKIAGDDGQDTGALGGDFSQAEYAAYLENRLARILSGMDGVGKVEVMITLSSSEELVVEKDNISSRSQTNETDSEGGSRLIDQADHQEDTVFYTVGNESEPYVIKTLLPSVEGVVVVAEGAGGGVMNKNITEVVQALFDVEAHKVKVVKMR